MEKRGEKHALYMTGVAGLVAVVAIFSMFLFLGTGDGTQTSNPPVTINNYNTGGGDSGLSSTTGAIAAGQIDDIRKEVIDYLNQRIIAGGTWAFRYALFGQPLYQNNSNMDNFGGICDTARNVSGNRCSGPDLVPAVDDFGMLKNKQVHFTKKVFPEGHPEVADGCVGDTGERKLMRFPTSLVNVGTEDAVVPTPDFADMRQDETVLEFLQRYAEESDLYKYANHAPVGPHLHLVDTFTWEIAPADKPDNVVKRKRSLRKAAFGHYDVMRMCSTPEGTARQAKYNFVKDATNMGIQPGWADVYQDATPCQYMDVTDLPAGDYVLTMETNAARTIDECNYNNNKVSIPVTIPSENQFVPDASDTVEGAFFAFMSGQPNREGEPQIPSLI